ncbi:MAG: VCBS repeat-containing protein, partial [Planctomycetota bacterium]|nr:VCBS repeat-containing protein [Planctomycetota bacterium]
SIKINDIIGDQIPDLLVTDEHLVQQYISGADGLPELPTATVDWSKFRNRLPEIKFDTGNIASISKYALFEEWSDLNADGALDLVVLSGGTVIIYMGSGKGLDLRRPKDQLPTRGNVLYATTSFVDSDEYPDLVLLRVEDISLMRLLSVLVMDISITFDILAYKGRGDGRFEKRPMKESKSIKLKVPNLSSLIKEEETIEDARQAIYRIADFDGDGRSTDLVALSPTGVLKTYLDVVSHPDLLDDLAESKIREILISSSVIELNAETIARWALGRTSLLASLVDGGMVAHVAAFSPDSEVEAPQAMAVRDVDGDGADEIILFRRVELESGDPGLRGFIFDPGAP